MKKIIYLMLSVLIILGVALAMAGSGGEYAPEKLFYRAMKNNEKIAINPDVAPPKLLETVENGLKKLLEKYPNANIARDASMALAEFYIVNKNYDKAHPTIDKIMKKYAKDEAIFSAALFLKGRAYELQGNWPKALKEFETLRDKYTQIQIGMQIPIYIAKYYESKGREADTKRAYSDAVEFYQRLQRENSGKLLGYGASVFLLQTYILSEDYEQAGKVLEETLNKYMSQIAITQLLPQVENIYVKKLNRPEKAIEIYKSVIAKVKNKQFVQSVQKRITVLEAKK
ncbi:MAG: tetratricopeptide repeat protein [Candidatus Omnitrophica bacterium]|nr:tetratricopeptide repeat protein [Candidatus Omnitrophota bacterium]